VGILGVLMAVRTLGFHWSRIDPQHVRSYVQSFGWWAPAIYVLVYAQPVIPLPASVMAMAAGLSFGLVGGLVMAVAAATIRGCGQFLISRALGREAIASMLKGRVAALDQRIGQRGFETVLWMRIVPNVPYDLQNVSLGCSRVAFRSFALATLLGIIPGLFLWVYVGHTLTDGRGLWKIAAGLIGLTVLWYLWRHSRRLLVLRGPS